MFLARPLTPQDIDLGRRMTADLIHRGPDAGGEWFDTDHGVYLGHRRLAIIDLDSRSDQPMVRGQHVLSYNGEIYNHLDLRERLESKGVRFKTTSDSETLLLALANDGEEVLSKADGMFALALWDGEEALLAVDHFAEKPLFVAETKNGTYASSELMPLVQHLGLELDTSPERLSEYLALGYYLSPHTALRGVSRVAPGSVLTVRQGRVARSRQYWKQPAFLPGKPGPASEKDLDFLAEALTTSLERRLLADVPIALFLSSGIDSSLVAALLARELGHQIQAITVSFPNEKGDEAEGAAAIARELCLPHERLAVREDLESWSPAGLIDFFGQPSDQTTVFAVHALAKALTGRYKVALSGMGGDELSLGYGKYEYLFAHRHILSVPRALKRVSKRIMPRVSATESWLDLFSTSQNELYPALKNYPAISWLRTLPGFDEWSQEQFSMYRGPAHSWVPSFELAEGMSGEHLLTYDLGSMRSSLELRTPFLNAKVAEAFTQLGYTPLLRYGRKSVLRRLLGRYLPRSLTDRPKQGFIAPSETIIENWPIDPPSRLPLSKDSVDACWRRRQTGKNWRRVAIRLTVADAYLEHLA